MKNKTIYLKQLIFILLFVYTTLAQQSVSPVWVQNPYIQANQAKIKIDGTTMFGASSPITYIVTFVTSFTGTPQLSLSIKNYRGNDGIIIQCFGLTKTASTSTSFTLYTVITGVTNIRIFSAMYLAVDPSFPNHLNLFNDIGAMYPINTFVNISIGLVGTRIQTNQINYTDLASTIGSAFTKFNPDFSQNYILPYMTAFCIYCTTATPIPIVFYQVTTQILSIDMFQLQVTVSPGMRMQDLKFSLIIYDAQDVKSSGSYYIIQQSIHRIATVDQYYPIQSIFTTQMLLGLLQFITISRSGLQFNWEYDMSNQSIIINASMPMSISPMVQQGFNEYTASLFYMKTWQCPVGYIFNINTDLCQVLCLQTGCCGNGNWTESFQACDDGNLDNNDGCSSTCQVETDFQCLLADKLPSGASLCKYMKDVTVQLSYFQKQLTSNTVHLFLTLGPSNLKGWSQSVVQSMLVPIQITDSTMGTANLIPVNNLTFLFNKNLPTNQIEIIIKYDIQSLENSFMRFKIDPNQTLISSINYKSVSSTIFLPLTTEKGVSLYNYDKETYLLQYILSLLAQIVGFLSLLILIIGWISPYGKIIILQALAVIQITYFSILQFPTLPPAYSSLKYLGLSNGFNNLSIIGLNFNTQQNDAMKKLMGLKNTVIENYNLSILLFLIPLVVGLIGILIYRRKKQSIVEQNLKDEQKARLKTQKINIPKNKNDLLSLIFKRIFKEASLYGFLACGYLAWTSIFYSIQKLSMIQLIISVVILCFWVLFGWLFLRKQTHRIILNEFKSVPNKIDEILDKNFQAVKNQTTILQGFGEFREVYELIQRQSFQKQSFKAKFYSLFMIQRIVLSSTIVFLPLMFSLLSALIIGLYMFLFLLIHCFRAYHQSKAAKSQKISLFSYLHKNYVLRQSINFLTVIIIQGLYLYLSILLQTSNKQDVFMTNIISTKIIPIAVILLCLLSLIWNLFLWIWQLKQEKAFQKTKIFFKMLFPSITCFEYKLSDKKQPKQHQFMSIKSSFKVNNVIVEQQNQFTNKLNQYVKQSSGLQIKNSPFVLMNCQIQENLQENYRSQKQNIKNMLRGQLLDKRNPLKYNKTPKKCQNLVKQESQKVNASLIADTSIIDKLLLIDTTIIDNLIDDKVLNNDSIIQNINVDHLNVENQSTSQVMYNSGQQFYNKKQNLLLDQI